MNYYTINSTIGDIGEVYENDQAKIEFTLEEVPEIKTNIVKEIKAGCGCTKTEINYKQDKTFSIIAIFDVGSIPYHLNHITEQKFSKKIYLTMKDGTKHELSFHGIRKRKKK